MAQRPSVLLRIEGQQRRAQPVGLPVCFALAPVAGVPGNTEQDIVMSPVLVQLIAVSALRSLARCAEKRQANRIVVALV